MPVGLQILILSSKTVLGEGDTITMKYMEQFITKLT